MVNAVRSTGANLLIYGVILYVLGLILYKVTAPSSIGSISASLTLLSGFLLIVSSLYTLCSSYAE